MFHFVIPPILKVADRKSSNPSWNRKEVKPTIILNLQDEPPINIIASSSHDGIAKELDAGRGLDVIVCPACKSEVKDAVKRRRCIPELNPKRGQWRSLQVHNCGTLHRKAGNCPTILHQLRSFRPHQLKGNC